MQPASLGAPGATGAAGRSPSARKSLGAFYTPEALVDLVVERTITRDWLAGRRAPVRVLDPACGDGRFLDAAARRIAALGGVAELDGLDVDPDAIAVATSALAGHRVGTLTVADGLSQPWPIGPADGYDLVIGNPPFLSQLAAGTTRGGASRHGGGPYADSAVEFLALAVRLADADGGRVALILPQSILASRDAGDVRAAVDRAATMTWSWWSPDRWFDADVLVCALGFERHGRAHATAEPAEPADPDVAPTWSGVVVRELGIPDLPPLATAGVLGDRARLNANFRDEYYGLVPAVSDEADGPPLVSSGLIDPGRCHWGERPVRFAKRSFAAPRVDVDRLDDRMRAWAIRKLVPKVLVATQTTIVEAVVDADGAWLPAVPVTSITPTCGTDPWELGAVLTSPVASVAAWHDIAGTGMSARSIRLGPAVLARIPWPGGDLEPAVAALRRGAVEECASAVVRAYGIDPDTPVAAPMTTWWRAALTRAATPRATAASTRR